MANLDTSFQLLDGKKTEDLDRHLPWKQGEAFFTRHGGFFQLKNVRTSFQYWDGIELLLKDKQIFQ